MRFDQITALLLVSVSLVVGASRGVGETGPGAPEAKGVLTIYSAYRVRPPSPTQLRADPRVHSDYVIHENGSEVRVHNQSGPFGEQPADVSLAPGAYIVNARFAANHATDFHVQIVPGQRTILYLVDEPLPHSFATAAPQQLRNDGKVVGWEVTIPVRGKTP